MEVNYGSIHSPANRSFFYNRLTNTRTLINWHTAAFPQNSPFKLTHKHNTTTHTQQTQHLSSTLQMHIQMHSFIKLIFNMNSRNHICSCTSLKVYLLHENDLQS